MGQRKPHLVEPQLRPELRKEVEKVLHWRWQRSKPIRIVAVIAILLLTTWVLVALFSPPLRYQLAQAPKAGITSEEFVRELQALSDGRFSKETRLEPLPNGENFYSAELGAIKSAQQSVNIEAYIFQKGEVTRHLVDALTDRARHGVQVRLVIDAVGSFTTPKRYFKELREAGGKVEFYHPIRWNTWMRSNNRTHRELTVVDGRVAFIGGAGFADHWFLDKKDHPHWRDNMFRVTGEAVTGLQGAFVENWLESSGELLSGDMFFPMLPKTGTSTTLTVASSPSQGGSTRGRILFQVLLASAKKSIDITTPYFLPDQSIRKELIEARKRGVQVRILVPGGKSDHLMTRASSRRVYGDLLLAGAHIYEYQPTMVHAKLMVVDGVWTVVGSTNFDNRSFGLNDEINMAAMDPALASTMTNLFQQDLGRAQEISYEKWRSRPVWERLVETAGWVIERQQ